MNFSFVDLDSDNSLFLIENALNCEEQVDMVALIALYEDDLAQPTRRIYGHRPKFYDITFNSGTVPSNHYKQAYKGEVVEKFSNVIKSRFDQFVPNNASINYNSNLVYYSPELANGGSRGKHQDNPGVPLSLVLIYSYGQSRILSIYKENKIVTKVVLKHNSILAMAGQKFQKVYYHQLDKLKNGVIANDRYSFNTRFMDPLVIE